MKKISRRNFLLASGVVTVGAALAACGGGSSSSTAASSAAPASSAAASAPAAAEGKVLNIWCWNDEFQSRFNDYYPEVKEIAADKSTTTLKDGTTVKWTINANENNNYQNKLDEALLNQDSAADDDKIDIFLIEADYALKYVDSDYVLDVVNADFDKLAGQHVRQRLVVGKPYEHILLINPFYGANRKVKNVLLHVCLYEQRLLIPCHGYTYGACLPTLPGSGGKAEQLIDP